MGRKALVIGAGGREHALVWKLKNSPDVDVVYAAPGNGGICADAQCVRIGPLDFDSLISFAKQKEIGLTVVGPELPLARGIVDAFQSAGLAIFGPTAKAAMLESSKAWAKDIMKKAGIPTAESATFTSYDEANNYIQSLKKFPIVIKADGLAAGKGVVIATDKARSITILSSIMVDKAFGDAGNSVVIEEFLTGEEASIIAITDGEYIMTLASSQDHKRVYDNDEGPNTGGMGAYSNAPVVDYNLSKAVEKKILFPLLDQLKKEGIVYKGVIYAGIMVTEDGPKVLEFNVRFGDPETQAILPRFIGDFYGLLEAAAKGGINSQSINWDKRQCVSVVLASGGYPGKYEKGFPILGIDYAKRMDDVIVFHAGTALREGGIVTNGGRVLNISALGNTLIEAKKLAYKAVSRISFENMFYRKDIGDKGINRLQETAQG